MSTLIVFLPVPVAVLVGWLFYRFNRERRWFSVGEMIFWDIIVLIVLQLLWLIWY